MNKTIKKLRGLIFFIKKNEFIILIKKTYLKNENKLIIEINYK